MYVLYFPVCTNMYIVNLPKCVFFLAPSLNGHVILHMLHNNCETTYISNVKLLILYETAAGAFPGSFPHEARERAMHAGSPRPRASYNNVSITIALHNCTISLLYYKINVLDGTALT